MSMIKDSTNSYFDLAVRLINCTGQHVFLTGKAGTGKTTFLKYIKQNSHKKLVVVAPTGVAAINAGGVTIHSFFQLPFGAFIPERNDTLELGDKFFDKNSLLRKIKLGSAKRNLIKELELLIIDEVSMVRADILDAMDAVLRSVRKQNLPFGGVQVLYIGDLFQLPPIISDFEKDVLEQYYSGPFFYNSMVATANPPVYIELKKIYRQSEGEFIRILNGIRNNQIEAADLEYLNTYYKPGFRPSGQDHYITLTTHNTRANAINSKELQNLAGKQHAFKAHVDGEFNENSVSAEQDLELKEGAQVMFIKNDTGEEKRYYNGKLGVVNSISDGTIQVRFPKENINIDVQKEVWKNVRYKLDSETDRVEEEVIGTFTQYPLKLAWAITIHKSQGLTFDKAIIDAGASFAPGQVYVALSRMRSLDGLVLHSKIQAGAILSDQDALEYSRHEKSEDDLNVILKVGRKVYIKDLILKNYQWDRLINIFNEFHKEMNGRKIPMQEDASLLAKELSEKILDLGKISERFVKELTNFLEAEQYDKVDERVNAATDYFNQTLDKQFLKPLQIHWDKFKTKARVKTYLKEISELIKIIRAQKRQLEESALVSAGICQNQDLEEILSRLLTFRETRIEQDKSENKEIKPKKTVKCDSQKLSLSLYQQGKSIAEIAEERSLSHTTIENHLIKFIETGEVEAEDFVESKKREEIISLLADLDTSQSLTSIKNALDDRFSYSEIRASISFREFQRNSSS